MSASTTKTKNQPSRKPVLLDYLKAFTKDKLIFAARQLCITYSKLKKDELAEKICTEMQKPEIAAKRFAIMPDENIQAFEAAMEKKCFHPTYSEYALLLPFISMGYIVSYPDDCTHCLQKNQHRRFPGSPPTAGMAFGLHHRNVQPAPYPASRIFLRNV